MDFLWESTIRPLNPLRQRRLIVQPEILEGFGRCFGGATLGNDCRPPAPAKKKKKPNWKCLSREELSRLFSAGGPANKTQEDTLTQKAQSGTFTGTCVETENVHVSIHQDKTSKCRLNKQTRWKRHRNRWSTWSKQRYFLLWKLMRHWTRQSHGHRRWVKSHFRGKWQSGVSVVAVLLEMLLYSLCNLINMRCHNGIQHHSQFTIVDLYHIH